MRAIIRFSINGEGSDTYLAQALTKLLRDAQFQRRGTGCWENDNIALPDMELMMNQFWAWVANPQSVPNVRPGVTIDHLWFYMDLPE